MQATAGHLVGGEPREAGVLRGVRLGVADALEFRAGEPWAQRRHLHAGAADLFVQALGEAGDVGLGSGVDGQLRCRLEACDAAHVEQVAAAPRHHHPERRFILCWICK